MSLLVNYGNSADIINFASLEPLQNTRKDREAEQFFLTEPDSLPLEPAPAMIRNAARLMRQSYAGQRTSLGLLVTILATLQTRGVLSHRYVLKQTPEYLILIDQRHPADHYAAYSDALVAALIKLVHFSCRTQLLITKAEST